MTIVSAGTNSLRDLMSPANHARQTALRTWSNSRSLSCWAGKLAVPRVVTTMATATRTLFHQFFMMIDLPYRGLETVLHLAATHAVLGELLRLKRRRPSNPLAIGPRRKSPSPLQTSPTEWRSRAKPTAATI